MKEHLLAIFFLVLLFFLYMAPMPDSILNNNIEDYREIKEEQIDHNQETEIRNRSEQDTIRTSVVAATRL